MDMLRKHTELECMKLIKKHNHADACWLVVRGRVLDVTSYLGTHPGGSACLLKATNGADATSAFDRAKHSSAAVWKLKDYDVGAANDLPKLREAATRAAAASKRLKAGLAITQRHKKEEAGGGS